MSEGNTAPCPRCGVPSPLTNKFCMACGSVTAPAAPPPVIRGAPLAPPTAPTTPMVVSSTVPTPALRLRPVSPSPLASEAPAPDADTIEPVVEGQPVEPIKRVMSWAIDLAIVLFVSTLVGSAVGALGAIVLFVGGPMYYLAAVGHLGTGTVGHRLLGLQVVDGRSGGAIGLLRAALRLSVAVVTVVPWGIAALFSAIGMFRGDGRLAWHDHASQAVVTTRRPVQRSAPPVSSST